MRHESASPRRAFALRLGDVRVAWVGRLEPPVSHADVVATVMRVTKIGFAKELIDGLCRRANR